VFCGFVIAGYLINSSYSDWKNSPVATTTTTYAIAGLDFPPVTVCPPRGSHTALNYDLMNADNDSLTEQDREHLKEVVDDIITETSHQEYIKQIVATVNPENIKKTYEGVHNVPKPSANAGLKIMAWNTNGIIKTPWFGEEYNKSYCTEDRDEHVILSFPEDLREKVGAGSLVIELEVDTSVEAGWHEQLRYKYQTNSNGLVIGGRNIRCTQKGRTGPMQKLTVRRREGIWLLF
jgi:hypothetical protein